VIAAALALWRWLAGTRVGRAVAMVAAALALLALVDQRGRSAGRRDMRDEVVRDERNRIDAMDRRVDEELDRDAHDQRDLDQRMRERGLFRDG
jgi:hypothetical protein